MKKSAIYILFILVCALVAEAANPVQSLKLCADKLSSAQSVSATFTLKGFDGEQQRGSMKMAGKACTVSAGGNTMWYDGTTQWVYSVQAQEVSVSTPAMSELAESNPFVLITEYKNNFNVSADGVSKAVLVPKDKSRSDFEKVLISFDAKGWPHVIDIRYRGGASLSVTINKISIGKALPASTFRFNAQSFPEAEIVDLR